MLRRTPERKPADSQAQRRSRFQVVKLEERIAPRCFYNPNAGKYVGCGRRGGYYCGPRGCF